MKTFEVLLNIIEKDIEHKLSTLGKEVDILNEILPGSVEINHSRREVINTYFEPRTEEEKEEMIKYIVEYINLVRVNYNNVISMVYSQMEATLNYNIKTMNKQNEFKNYAKQNKGKSSLQNMFDFVVAEKNYTPKESENELITGINGIIRSKRNKIMHDLYDVFTDEDAVVLIDDGKNLDSKLYCYYNWYVEELNALLNITKRFFTLCERI